MFNRMASRCTFVIVIRWMWMRSKGASSWSLALMYSPLHRSTSRQSVTQTSKMPREDRTPPRARPLRRDAPSGLLRGRASGQGFGSAERPRSPRSRWPSRSARPRLGRPRSLGPGSAGPHVSTLPGCPSAHFADGDTRGGRFEPGAHRTTGANFGCPLQTGSHRLPWCRVPGLLLPWHARPHSMHLPSKTLFFATALRDHLTSKFESTVHA